MHANKKAFTLIELLIVVAIIAILAAIAVPNLLEAQTRSKISRTLSDMRVVDVAIKAYNVDYERNPSGQGWLMLVPAPAGPSGSSVNSKKYIGAFLTTPVAYISQVPMDYFNSNIRPGGDFYPGARQASYVITAAARYSMFAGLGGGVNQYSYFMESAGPDLVWWTQNGRQSSKFHYDPTNGTLSQGQIVISDKGFISPSVSGLPYFPIT